MADVGWKYLVLFFYFTKQSTAIGVFDNLLSDSTPCEVVCTNTFPLHTYEKADHLCYCRRGCRLFSLVEFVTDDLDVNKTTKVCINSCKDAYTNKEDFDACSVGCNSQVQFAVKRRQTLDSMDTMDPFFSMMSPIQHMHEVFSSMMDEMLRHADDISNRVSSYSWSYSMRPGPGGSSVVVIQSGDTEPRVYTDFNTDSALSLIDVSKTSDYIDTNLAAIDNSATPNVKHSQINPSEIERDIRDMSLGGQEVNDENSSDWLECIARKTGLSHLFLSLTIFCSALSMIWLCCTTAVTAPEQKIATQKLSIYGDLDYLKEMAVQKKLSLADFHPQEKSDAVSLPIKIKIDQI